MNTISSEDNFFDDNGIFKDMNQDIAQDTRNVSFEDMKCND